MSALTANTGPGALPSAGTRRALTPHRPASEVLFQNTTWLPLASSETPGFGDQIKSDYYRKQYAGAPAEQLTLAKSGDPTAADAQIVAITGATVSSEAVVDIVNTFLTQIKGQMQEKGLIGNGNQ